MWNIDSMAGTADAVNYVQRNAADPSQESLRLHVQNRNTSGCSEIRVSQPNTGGWDCMMLDVSDEQLERMKAWHMLQKERMLLHDLGNDPDRFSL